MWRVKLVTFEEIKGIDISLARDNGTRDKNLGYDRTTGFGFSSVG